ACRADWRERWILRRLRRIACRKSRPHAGSWICLSRRAFAFPGYAARRAERASAAAGFRQLPAEPRPDRQSSFRRAADHAGVARGADSGDRDPASRAIAAAVLHGRGSRCDHAVPVLLRFHRRSRQRRARGTPPRIRPLSGFRLARCTRAHPRSAGHRHFRAQQDRTRDRAAGSRDRCALPSIARSAQARDRAAPDRHESYPRTLPHQRSRLVGRMGPARWQPSHAHCEFNCDTRRANREAARTAALGHRTARRQAARLGHVVVDRNADDMMSDDIEIIRSYQDAWGHHRDVPEGTIHRLEEALQRTAGEPTPQAQAEPRRCFEPEWMARQERRWGVAVQLYGIRSPRNWGIGDFSDLKQVAQLAAQRGADFAGVNPLHALYAAEPRRYSPYSPSSREFLNVLYIDPEAMQALAISPTARAHIAQPGFRDRLQALRDAPLVDYEAVALIKREIFRLVFTDFATLCAREPDHPI